MGQINYSDGIQFPAAQVSSAGVNVLDDYEEGTKEVAMGCSTSGTITIHNTYKTVAYTKIGRVVTVTGYLHVDSVSSPVGNWLITGMPFTCQSGLPYEAAGSIAANGLVSSAATAVTVNIGNGGDTLYISLYTAGALSGIANSVQAGSNIAISITYFAAT
jgi:hypothetical protein